MPPEKLVWGAKLALYENFSSFDCTKTIVFIRIILHVMGTGRFLMNKYCKFHGKIITLSSFLSAPQKRVQFAYIGPTADICEKMVGAESVKS
jgi:hypothetical protein